LEVKCSVVRFIIAFCETLQMLN